MSTIAQAILEQIKALPPAEQREVFAGLEGIFHTDDAPKSAQRAVDADPIPSARGMFAGSRLTEALHASRAEEEKAVASKKAAQLAAMHRLCGSSKGEGLLGKLLADRAKERARG